MKTILIVDDANETAEVLSLILKMDGYRVFCASNGVEGLAKAREVKPDLILVDHRMPVMDGATMGELLRSEPSSATTKIVMHSCLPEDVLDPPTGAYDAFLRKPYDVDVVLKLIEGLIKDQNEPLEAEAEYSRGH